MSKKKNYPCDKFKFKICFCKLSPASKDFVTYSYRCNVLTTDFLDFLLVLKRFGFIYDYVITSDPFDLSSNSVEHD